MALTAQDIADKFTEDRIRKARMAPGLTPEDHQLLDAALAIKNPPLSGERKQKLQRDIAAGQFPLPGGQWTQVAERLVNKVVPGATGPDTGESVPAAIGHQLGATAVNTANTVLPLGMTTLANLGDLSDALLQNRGPITQAANALPNIFPRSQQMRQYLATAPSPALAGLSGATLGMGATAPSGTNTSGARVPGGPLESAAAPMPANPTAADVVRTAMAPIPRSNSPVANIVGLNTVLASAEKAQDVAQGANQSPVEQALDIGAEAVNPVNVLPTMAAGLKTRPYTETKGYQQAQRYARVRRAGGGNVPSEYTEATGEPAMRTHREEGNRLIDEARARARDEAEAMRLRNQADLEAARASIAAERDRAAASGKRELTGVVERTKGDVAEEVGQVKQRTQAEVAEAEAAAKNAIERAAVEGEETFSAGDRAANKAWFGEGGQPGEFARARQKLIDENVRVDPSDATKAMEAAVLKHAATSEPLGPQKVLEGEKVILFDEKGNAAVVEGKNGEKRYLSLGAAMKGAADAVKSFLGKNPGLAEYQNALQELGAMADKYKTSPAAKQAFTELAAKVRDDSYQKIPGWEDLAGRNKQVMDTQERGQQIMYGGDDVANATATREGGQASLLPVALERRGVRNLMKVDETAHDVKLADELAKLTDFGRRAVEAVRAAKQSAGAFTARVKSKADEAVARAEGEGQKRIEQAEGAVREFGDEVAGIPTYGPPTRPAAEYRATVARTQGDMATMDQRARQRLRRTKAAGAEAVDTAETGKQEKLLNQDAVDKARFPEVKSLAVPAAWLAGAASFGGWHSLPMLAVGGTHLASKLSPWARARAAYLVGEPNLTAESLGRSLPALSGPLAMSEFDLATPTKNFALSPGFGNRAKDAIIQSVAKAAEERRKEAEEQAEAQRETNRLLRENQP